MTDQSESTGAANPAPPAARRFVTRDGANPIAVEESGPVPGRDWTRRSVVTACAMGLAGVLLVAGGIAVGVAKGPAVITEAEQQQAFSLQQEIRTAEGREEALPSVTDTERALVAALSAAQSVAGLQNDYLTVAPEVAAHDGVLDGDLVYDTRRDLAPYFGSMADQTLVDPWYLLRDDGALSAGTGLSLTFPSGVRWEAQTPYRIDVDGGIGVVWLAVETRPAEGFTPRVLAVVRGEYDVLRQVFTDVRIGTTQLGEARRLEVTVS